LCCRTKEEEQTTQWPKEEEQTTQWPKEEEQTTQWTKEEEQTTQWTKEEEQTTQWTKEEVQKDKQRSTKHTYKTIWRSGSFINTMRSRGRKGL
jgi:hypothetical protein